MKKQAKGDVRKFRTYAPVRRVGVSKGHGPRHAENAKEGELPGLPNTDTVPAMLTPREAVMNRNAAELAGRDNIEQLNAVGNKLAEQGVDLAGGKNMKEKAKKYQGGGNVGDPAKKPGVLGQPQQGVLGQPFGQQNPPSYFAGGAMPPESAPGMQQPMPPLDWQHKRNQANLNAGPGLDWQHKRNMAIQRGFDQPAMPPSQWGPMPLQGGGGEPPGAYNAGGFGMTPEQKGPNMPLAYGAGNRLARPFGMQSGASEVPGIGAPNPQTAYGPPVQLSAPDLSALLAKAGKEQGLNASQIAGLAKAFSSFGGGGGADTLYGSGGGEISGLTAAGGFQGGISDIGYPPFVAPGAEYHADKGGWLGPYDPAYTFNSYWRGTSDVPFR